MLYNKKAANWLLFYWPNELVVFIGLNEQINNVSRDGENKNEDCNS
jgi:hypothetical protein